MPIEPQINWPKKHDVIGVQVSATDYQEIIGKIVDSANHNQPAQVSTHAVHAIVESSGNPELLKKVNRFNAVCPDGQPVRWALNRLHGCGLKERVYGPHLTLLLVEECAAHGIPVYFYGSTPEVLSALCHNFQDKFPQLKIAGSESPPFRPLTEYEKNETGERINNSGAKVVFIGLGAPKQDFFADEMRKRILGVQVCVGAAFDFHAGNKKMAPVWMQRNGVEWVFRLVSEPRRLFWRYTRTNTIFVCKYMVSLVRKKTNRSSRKWVGEP